MGKLALFCGPSYVSWEFAGYVLKRNPERIAFIEFSNEPDKDILELAMKNRIPILGFTKEERSVKMIQVFEATTVVLLWWPKIVHQINKIGINVINTHPSYLPYNRGKHPYYWSIVDGTPFGATIHRVDDGIDTGTILWRTEVKLTPRDTGETAYNKAVSATRFLLSENYDNIVNESFPAGVKQDDGKATYHHSSELEAPLITDKDPIFAIIQDLRARTFDNAHSGRRILMDDGMVYRIHLKLVEEEHETD